jgi:hypothetical protein
MIVAEFFSIYLYHNLKLTQFSNQANRWIKLDHKIGHKISKITENATDIKLILSRIYHS